MHSFRWQMVVVLLLLATVTFAAQHNAGVIMLPPAGTYTPQLSGLSDAILNTVAALEDWNVLLLHPQSPLLNSSETIKLYTDAATPALQVDALPKIAAALDLDDVFLIRIAVAENTGNTEKPQLATLWAIAGSTEIRSFSVEMEGLSSKDARKTAENFAAWLTRGFENAPLYGADEEPSIVDTPPVTPPAPAPAPQPATPPTIAETPPATQQPQPSPAQAIPATPPADTQATTIPATTQPTTPEPEQTDTPPQNSQAPVETPPAITTPAPQPEQPAPQTPHTDAARQAIADGNIELARRELELGHRAGEPSIELYLVRADLARVQGDPMGQRKSLESAARLGPENVEPLLQLAALFRSQGLWQKALKTYDQAIAVDKACTAAYSAAAGVASANQMPRKAAEYLEQAVTHEVDNISLLVKLGDAYRAADDFPKAEEAYELAIRGADQRTRSLVFDRLGDMYVEEDRYEDAFNSYVEATRLRDDADRKYARERYAHVMRTADEAVISNLNICTDLFDAYSASRNVPREKVYIASEHATMQIQKVIDFAASISAPEDLTELHLRRQVAYNLAFEAAVNLMTYIDTNLEDPLTIYHRAVTETSTEFQLLRQARGN